MPLKDELDVEVNGRDVITGLPKTVRIESEEIRRALNKPLDEMAKAVKDALDATPPDLASDLMYVVNGCARVLEANAFDGGFVQTNA